eukprot:6150187-Amphidinium_carterae.1
MFAASLTSLVAVEETGGCRSHLQIALLGTHSELPHLLSHTQTDFKKDNTRTFREFPVVASFADSFCLLGFTEEVFANYKKSQALNTGPEDVFWIEHRRAQSSSAASSFGPSCVATAEHCSTST